MIVYPNKSKLTNLKIDMLSVITAGLRRADPYEAGLTRYALEGAHFVSPNFTLDLSKFERVFVVGAGKATLRLAEAVETILGHLIYGGCVSVKSGLRRELENIKVMYSAHPVPDASSYKAGRTILELCRETSNKDVVFSLMTGGYSSLMPVPIEQVKDSEKSELHKILVSCGAEIAEINAVRKHVSQVKGGRLGLAIAPSTIVNLCISDIVGDKPDLIAGPTVPDTSTFDDVEQVLTKYNLWNRIPKSVSEYIQNTAIRKETPKYYESLYYLDQVLPRNAACLGAAQKASELGYSPRIITNDLEGDVDAACSFFRNCIELALHRRKKIALIAGGENTIKVPSECFGTGGPNQHFALSMVEHLAGVDNVCLAAIDTDGTDGPTNFAGGIIDGSSLFELEKINMHPSEYISSFRSTEGLIACNGALQSGHTGTNVNDLKVVLIG